MNYYIEIRSHTKNRNRCLHPLPIFKKPTTYQHTTANTHTTDSTEYIPAVHVRILLLLVLYWLTGILLFVSFIRNQTMQVWGRHIGKNPYENVVITRFLINQSKTNVQSNLSRKATQDLSRQVVFIQRWSLRQVRLVPQMGEVTSTTRFKTNFKTKSKFANIGLLKLDRL